MHEKHIHQLPSPQARHIWAILLSFNFTYTVQTRPCTNEALIINYTELCYGWNRNWTYFLNSKNVNRKVQGVLQSQTAANPDTKRKRKRTKTSRAKQTRMHEKHIDQLPPPQAMPIGLFCYLLSFLHCTNEALYKRGPGRVWYRISQYTSSYIKVMFSHHN